MMQMSVEKDGCTVAFTRAASPGKGLATRITVFLDGRQYDIPLNWLEAHQLAQFLDSGSQA